ncbi:3495_t:CDS:2 [Funneliformis caledonium]|uniref:3495_t:CDS:1 n=1 Tax=Funneliformis caledonium TaxID=1117310 RepID=A0A9N9ABF8_9GLOM|nr:3495_t:CDS:2 [Funneliformis caledonium]
MDVSHTDARGLKPGIGIPIQVSIDGMLHHRITGFRSIIASPVFSREYFTPWVSSFFIQGDFDSNLF